MTINFICLEAKQVCPTNVNVSKNNVVCIINGGLMDGCVCNWI